jgi:hypothetical protein
LIPPGLIPGFLDKKVVHPAEAYFSTVIFSKWLKEKVNIPYWIFVPFTEFRYIYRIFS